tara:strand:+ start:2784 stop:3269 length:486 start_codon:yes stop_codon:yes gene_type:complete
MPSFDVISKIDHAEIDNAINGAMREIGTRYDFKNSQSKITRIENEIEMIADDNYKIEQVSEILRTYCVRRKINTGFLTFLDIKDSSGGLLKQKVTITEGIDREISQKINKEIKSSKLKVQVEIRGEELRINGKKRDQLQECIGIIKNLKIKQPLQFINFRD